MSTLFLSTEIKICWKWWKIQEKEEKAEENKIEKVKNCYLTRKIIIAFEMV